MKKSVAGTFFTALTALFLGGALLEWDLHQGAVPSQEHEKKPLISDTVKEETSPVIQSDTAVVFQQVYLKSQEMVTGALPEQSTLVGKTLADIYRFYPKERGYDVKYEANELTIRQKIDDFSPQQKQKYRLKIYQDFVAVYQGPTTEQDVLQRVTSIRYASLPLDIQEKLKAGEYEFENMNQLDDVLMNFDEWAE